MRSLPLVALVAGLCGLPVVSGCVPDAAPDTGQGTAPAEAARPADAQPPRPRVDVDFVEFWGTVTAVTKDSITIDPGPGSTERVIDRRVPGGSVFFGFVREPAPPR